MDKIFELIGLGAPFAAALATYQLFNFLDQKASPEAMSAIAAWTDGRKYERLDLSNAVLNGFDHLYGTPLFSIRALIRSSAFSLIGIVIYQFAFAVAEVHSLRLSYLRDFPEIIRYYVPPIIVSDYLSLFVVRKCLSWMRAGIWVSILLALATAIAMFYLTAVIIQIEPYLFVPPFSLHEIKVAVEFWANVMIVAATSIRYIYYGDVWKIIIPALFVHLWLVLFVIGATANSGIRRFFQGVTLARWFLKRGDEHPLEAVGMIMSIVVLVVMSFAVAIQRFS